MDALGTVIVLAIAGTAVWVYFDAKNLGVQPGSMPRNGFLDAGPAGWAAACLFIWIVAFPMYLAARPSYVRQQDR